MNKELSTYTRFLHWLDMKINKSTCYSSKGFTLKDLLYHSYRRVIYPFKKRGLWGYCDECGKFEHPLFHCIVGADMDYDADGQSVATPEWGFVCATCYYTLTHQEPED